MVTLDTSIDVLSVLEALKGPVRDRIRAALPRRFPEEHYEAIREYPEREGKYFRPALALLGAELFGGSREAATPIAAAIQLSEEWLLVHDDVEDHSPLRRGAPALQELWGEEIAVNAGDALHILMWRVLGAAMREVPEEIGWKLFDRLNEILLTTTEGQFLELAWRREGHAAFSEADYLAMAERKSAGYTVLGPLSLGAIVAGAEAESARIATWAVPFGLAFQIRDDLLDIESDIHERKPTLMLAHLLAHVAPDVKEQTLRMYGGRGEATAENERQIAACMEEAGSIAYAASRTEALSGEARAAFDVHVAELPDTPAKDIVRAMIEFAATRRH